jgi:hypothetical protein
MRSVASSESCTLRPHIPTDVEGAMKPLGSEVAMRRRMVIVRVSSSVVQHRLHLEIELYWLRR